MPTKYRVTYDMGVTGKYYFLSPNDDETDSDDHRDCFLIALYHSLLTPSGRYQLICIPEDSEYEYCIGLTERLDEVLSNIIDYSWLWNASLDIFCREEFIIDVLRTMRIKKPLALGFAVADDGVEYLDEDQLLQYIVTHGNEDVVMIEYPTINDAIVSIEEEIEK